MGRVPRSGAVTVLVLFVQIKRSSLEYGDGGALDRKLRISVVAAGKKNTLASLKAQQELQKRNTKLFVTRFKYIYKYSPNGLRNSNRANDTSALSRS